MEDDLPLVHKFEPFTHQPIENVPKKKQNKIKSFFAWIWGQIKRHKIIVAAVAVIIAICVALFIVIPVVAIGPMKFVNADTTTRIELGQTAKLKYSNVSVKINRFISDVCPVKTCFGPHTPIIDYDFIVDGQKYVETSLTPNVPVYRFQIKTVGTDNKTYADIKIVKS
jgi:hypothetical protein